MVLSRLKAHLINPQPLREDVVSETNHRDEYQASCTASARRFVPCSSRD